MSNMGLCWSWRFTQRHPWKLMCCQGQHGDKPTQEGLSAKRIPVRAETGAVAACPITQRQGGEKFQAESNCPWIWPAPRDQEFSPAHLPMASDSVFWQKKAETLPSLLVAQHRVTWVASLLQLAKPSWEMSCWTPCSILGAAGGSLLLSPSSISTPW